MSTEAISPSPLLSEPCDFTQEQMLELCGLTTLRQLRAGIDSGRIPQPDLRPGRNTLRWRKSTVERWLCSARKPTREGASDA